jgi:hypothetical protein
MNGSAENTAHGAPEKPGRREVALNLATARSMLPLVQRIVADIQAEHQRLTANIPEQAQLHRQRRTLAWPQRARLYQIQEEIAGAERELQQTVAELAGLGVVLLDAAGGRVGFPTIVNGRPAYFSWRSGDQGIHYWHFPEQADRRPIPASWFKSANISLSVKS